MSTPGKDNCLPAYRGQAEFLEGFLRAVRDGLRRRAAARVLWWVPAGMLTAAGVALLTDAAFGCPAAWRGVVYAALLLTSAGASAALVLGAWLRRPSLPYVARLIERARPDLKNALITFLELARDPGEDPSACAAVGRRAARILGEMHPTEVLPPYNRRPAALAAAVMAGVVAAGLWLAQGVFIAPWIEGARASTAAAPGSGGPDAPRGTAADAVASAGAAAQAPGAPDGSGAAAGSARAPDGAADPPSAGGAGANSGQGGAGEGGRAGPEQGGAGDGAGAGSGQGDAGTGAGDGAGDSGSSQAVASAVRGDQPTFDRLARALGQEGIGGAEPSPGGAAERAASGRPGSPDSSGGRGTPDATGATDPSAAGGESGDGGTSRPDGRGAGPEEGAAPGAGGSGGSASTQAGRRDGPPIPPRPQGSDFPPEALDALRAARRIIEKAEERLQDGEANDGFLGEIGMSREEFRRFVVAWKRRLETAAAGPDATAAPEASRAAAAPPVAEVLQPGRADAARAVRGGESGEADATELFAGDETAVSPRLRPAVSAYFEALGRLARQRAKTKEGG